MLVFFAAIACQHTQPASNRTISQGLDSLLTALPDFSGVVLVAERGRPVYHKAFGYKNFVTKAPVDTTSIFELASVSKQFTAMAIMMLKERGLLSFDDDIARFLPDLPWSGITIRHLLNHTSGLPDYQTIMDQYWDKTLVAGNDDNIAYLKRYRPKPHFAPGEKYEYSNTGYMLLASIAEKASGRDFIDLSREWIFRPLEMNQTDIRNKESKLGLPEMAWGHIYVPEKDAFIHADSFPAFNYSIWLGNRKGPGRLSSTTSDLLQWDQALYAGELVKDETLREAFAPARLNDDTRSGYGFGWMLDDHPRLGRKIFHTGDNPGYKTIIVRYPDVNKTLIILSNNAHKEFHELVKAVENLI